MRCLVSEDLKAIILLNFLNTKSSSTKMKKPFVFVFTCLFICLTFSNVKAQETKGLLKAGAGVARLLYSKQNEPAKFEYGSLFAYQAGLGVRRQFTEQFGIQAELLYLRHGGTFGENDSVNVNFNSIGIAALLLYKPLSWLELEAGLMPNYTLSINNGKGHDLSNLWDNSDFDSGLLLGMRYFITNNFSINPRIHYGLLARKILIYKPYNGLDYDIEERRFNHFNAQITLEYSFDL